MPPIRIEGLTKQYKDGPRAVDDVNLEIRDGELVVARRAFGLRQVHDRCALIAGLDGADAGDHRASASATSTRRHPRERDIAMVFQSYALYPHTDRAATTSLSALKLQAGAARRDRRRACTRSARQRSVSPPLPRPPP